MLKSVRIHWQFLIKNIMPHKIGQSNLLHGIGCHGWPFWCGDEEMYK